MSYKTVLKQDAIRLNFTTTLFSVHSTQIGDWLDFTASDAVKWDFVEKRRGN